MQGSENEPSWAIALTYVYILHWRFVCLLFFSCAYPLTMFLLRYLICYRLLLNCHYLRFKSCCSRAIHYSSYLSLFHNWSPVCKYCIITFVFVSLPGGLGMVCRNG
ncbi:hypothetical protein BGX38DRAFT_679756 [Terfezia claveryi]|nr:hypothetical protein BGX38DRAFT_679756 [Terfezia claveryi]